MTNNQVEKLIDNTHRIALALEELTKVFIRLEETLQEPEEPTSYKPTPNWEDEI